MSATNPHGVHFHITARCEDVTVFGGRYNNFGTFDDMGAATFHLLTVVENMRKGGMTFRKISPNKYIFGENPYDLNGEIELTGCYSGGNCLPYRKYAKEKREKALHTA